MDKLFQDLVGIDSDKKNAAIVTITVHDFSLIENHARFLQAVLAIPIIKSSHFSRFKRRIIHFGQVHEQVSSLIKRGEYESTRFEDIDESICDKLDSVLLNQQTPRSILFLNDLSGLELNDLNEDACKRILSLIYRLKFEAKHFVVLLCQQQGNNRLFRDLKYLSDGVVDVRAYRDGYHKVIRSRPSQSRFIPYRPETKYYLSKIGKDYFSDYLCFQDRKEVHMKFNPQTDAPETDYAAEDEESYAPTSRPVLKKDETLPHFKAQDPSESRIFYYPDKNDDVDEEDPDDDLGI